MNTIEALTIVRQRLEQGWTQGTDARDKFDIGVGPESYLAVTWCISGAIETLRSGDDYTNIYDVQDAITNQLYQERNGNSFVEFNDAPERTQQEVLDFIDRTIASLGGS